MHVLGGDDTRVLVWKLAEAVRGHVVPRCLKRTHLSNIFCASFDSENKHIITAGKNFVQVYNIKHINSINNCFLIVIID